MGEIFPLSQVWEYWMAAGWAGLLALSALRMVPWLVTVILTTTYAALAAAILLIDRAGTAQVGVLAAATLAGSDRPDCQTVNRILDLWQ